MVTLLEGEEGVETVDFNHVYGLASLDRYNVFFGLDGQLLD